MALTNVTNHLKTMATGFADKASGLANGLTGGITGLMKSASGSQAKVAAQLLKKSPFEVPDSPIAKATADPLQFSHVSYPRDLESTGLGHCMIFYAMSNSYEDVEADLKFGGRVSAANIMDEVALTGNVVKNIRGLNGKPFTPVKSNNSVLSKIVRAKTATAAIALYMPPGIQVKYSMAYEVEATDAAGTAASIYGNKGAGVGGLVKAITTGVGAVGIEVGKKLIDEVSAALGAGRPAQLISKALGVATNPHEEMFFKKPNFRSFGYTFDFYPKSVGEMEDVNKIIMLFKYHMHPGLDTSSIGGRLFKVPSEFEIHYAYLGQENEYLNKISTCVLKNMDVAYGPEEQWSTFRNDAKGAPPVHTKVTLEFEETQFITKKEITEGY
jgi:hypothetical protein